MPANLWRQKVGQWLPMVGSKGKGALQTAKDHEKPFGSDGKVL